MTPTSKTTGLPEELVGALEAFTGISDSLLQSYRDLERRAERVDRELCRTNEELKNKVRELDATRAHLEAILKALPTGVVVRDALGSIVRTNDAAVAILGTPAAELVGRHGHPMLADDVGADGETRETRRADGRRVVLVSKRSTIESDGAPSGFVEILDDRTELTELTERLHRADKMAALGTMAGGIAHEIRNPMNAVKGFAGLLRRELDESTREHRWATTISAGVDEVENIITNMLTLAHPERLRLEDVDSAELVEQAVAAAHQTLPPGTDRSRWNVTTRVSTPLFRGDRIKLRQALRNVVANAIEVQPEGGRIDIDVRLVGDEVTFTVSDDGPGIPPELQERVVDPFFTTRAEGTGLGLALVHAIVQLHGGRLTIDHGCPRADAGLAGAHISFCVPFTTT